MAGWTDHRGTALVLGLENVDTDQIIPARFMSVPRSEGCGRYLLHDRRRDEGGALRGDFPLNRHEGVSVLVAGRNFGTGSSREAAVYALVDAGIKAVVAPSFGDIFAGNAVNNGLLPAQVSEADHARLCAALPGGVGPVALSLEGCEIVAGELRIRFALDETACVKLRNGWDDIDLTLSHAERIAAFRAARLAGAGWVWPGAG